MYKDILLAVDLAHEDTQHRAIEEAVALAKASGATIHVITIVPDYGMSLVGGFSLRSKARTLTTPQQKS